jgi:hypothetical protein
MVLFLRWVVLVGFSTFAAAFAALVVAPDALERQAREYVIGRVRDEMTRQFPTLASAENLDRIAGLGAALRNFAADLAARVPDVRDLLDPLFSHLCKYDCLDRDGKSDLANAVVSFLGQRLEQVGLAFDRIADFVRGRYDELIGNLVRDLRIFTAVNAALFALAFFALRSSERGRSPATAKAGTERAAVTVAAILVITALAGAALYLFAQRWLFTILFADYVGYGYLVWVAAVGAVLSDIAFNRGRVFRAMAQTTTA